MVILATLIAGLRRAKNRFLHTIRVISMASTPVWCEGISGDLALLHPCVVTIFGVLFRALIYQ